MKDEDLQISRPVNVPRSNDDDVKTRRQCIRNPTIEGWGVPSPDLRLAKSEIKAGGRFKDKRETKRLKIFTR